MFIAVDSYALEQLEVTARPCQGLNGWQFKVVACFSVLKQLNKEGAMLNQLFIVVSYL